MNKEISEKAHLRSNFREKEYLLEWGSNPRKYYIFRADIEKFFVRFLVQMKISISPFENNWPLKANKLWCVTRRNLTTMHLCALPIGLVLLKKMTLQASFFPANGSSVRQCCGSTTYHSAVNLCLVFLNWSYSKTLCNNFLTFRNERTPKTKKFTIKN